MRHPKLSSGGFAGALPGGLTCSSFVKRELFPWVADQRNLKSGGCLFDRGSGLAWEIGLTVWQRTGCKCKVVRGIPLINSETPDNEELRSNVQREPILHGAMHSLTRNCIVLIDPG